MRISTVVVLATLGTFSAFGAEVACQRDLRSADTSPVEARSISKEELERSGVSPIGEPQGCASFRVRIQLMGPKGGVSAHYWAYLISNRTREITIPLAQTQAPGTLEFSLETTWSGTYCAGSNEKVCSRSLWLEPFELVLIGTDSFGFVLPLESVLPGTFTGPIPEQISGTIDTSRPNQPLHHDASGGLTAAVVAGERQR